MNPAFLLGAGLGTRLRPLTHRLPKPLVPLFHRPLVDWALEACERAGCERFAINTHHLPEAWRVFGDPPDGSRPAICGANGETAVHRAWKGRELTLFHEPVLLDTGGGLKNIASWIGGEPLLIHNGDIFSSMPLDRLVAAHRASGLPVTLAMRSEGGEKRIALDAARTRALDVRGLLGRAEGTHVFSGIYCIDPAFLERLPADEVVSVIPAFVELARKGKLGAVVLDDGHWLDLGDRASYLQAHRDLDLAAAVHPRAMVEPEALVEHSVVGPGSVIAAGAIVRNSVVWPGQHVSGDAVLDGCIVCSGDGIHGRHQNADI